jgi:hypothetical protein
MSRLNILARAAAAAAMLLAATAAATAQEKSGEDLAKLAQNPIADMMSFPFQNNANFVTGPYGETQNDLNVQPVIPFHISEDWTVISRTILPVINQVGFSPTDSGTFGIGDLNPGLYLTQAHPGELIWGVGPIALLPTASSRTLGTGKWSFGPTAVALTIQGHWLIGVVANNVWSVAGFWDRTRVNQLTAQPFINYNLPDGLYLTSSPIITSNWVAKAGDQLTLPLGGGIGKVFRFEGQAFNAQLQAFYNVARPEYASRWQLRFELAALFPDK